MNIPKPALLIGFVALVGVYVFIQASQNTGPQTAPSTHTHADGTVHEGEHVEDTTTASSQRLAPTAAPAAASASAPVTHMHPDGTVHPGPPHSQQNAAPLSDPNGGKLRVTDTKKGTGATATNGKTLSMHYRGTLTNGTQFDASYDRGQPFRFTLGAGQVIKGWDQGIKGMKVGGKRKLVIPGSLAYGPRGAGGVIPPNATLLFEVELLDVKWLLTFRSIESQVLASTWDSMSG
jgi:FKBP-type peptidyl-prolyl cis-trans isomerase